MLRQINEIVSVNPSSRGLKLRASRQKMGRMRNRMARKQPKNGHAKAAAAARQADRREAARLLALLAQPDGGARTRQRRLYTASIKALAAMLDWRPGRVEDIWIRGARRIDAWEMDALRARAREVFRQAE